MPHDHARPGDGGVRAGYVAEIGALQEVAQGGGGRGPVHDHAVADRVFRSGDVRGAQHTPAAARRRLGVANLHQAAAEVDADNRLFAHELSESKHFYQFSSRQSGLPVCLSAVLRQ